MGIATQHASPPPRGPHFSPVLRTSARRGSHAIDHPSLPCYRLPPMESAPFFFAIALWLILCVIVAYVASQRGHSGAGFLLLALFISPILGLIIVLCLRPRPKSGIATQADVSAYLAYRAAQQQKAGSRSPSQPPPPPGRLPRYQIARAGEILGHLTLAEIRQALSSGQLSHEDHWWDEEGQCWQEIAALDTIA